jgi:hypothetical protein
MVAPPCKTHLLCKFKSRSKNRIQCTWKRVIPADRNRWLSLYGPSASQVSGDSQGTENQQKHRQKHRTYTSQMTRDSQDTQNQKELGKKKKKCHTSLGHPPVNHPETSLPNFDFFVFFVFCLVFPSFFWFVWPVGPFWWFRLVCMRE